MSLPATIEYACLSDRGLVRTHNEDAIIVLPDNGLAILADGMGGYNAGEVASQMSADIVAEKMKQFQAESKKPRMPWQSSQVEKWMVESIRSANQQVLATAQQNPEQYGMGTTMVVALNHGDKLTIGHVGDSRAYRLRQNKLETITKDHSVIQAQIDAGLLSEFEAQYSPIKNLITRAVGSQEDIEVEVHQHQLIEGDLYMLCSDGLNDMLTHEELELVLKEQGGNLDLCCQTLIYLANRQGGADNVSVVLFKVKQLPEKGLMGYIFPD